MKGEALGGWKDKTGGGGEQGGVGNGLLGGVGGRGQTLLHNSLLSFLFFFLI